MDQLGLVSPLIVSATVSYTHLDVYKRQVLQTAVSDLEVVQEEEQGYLWHICLLYTSRCV